MGSTDQVSDFYAPTIYLDKSFENQSNMSGGKRSDKNVTVNFAIGGYGAATAKPANDNVASVASGSGSGTAYGIPTLKMLNPELYKEMEKQEKQMKDPIFTSVRNLRERYGYHEIRAQRIAKRTEELTKELEMKNEEMLKKKKAQQLRQG